MSFNTDVEFSKHKDILLKDYWGSISFEGRYVLTGSEFLQKTHGIDVIAQTKNDKSDIKIDTKHVRGNYSKLFIEEMSCSVPGRENKGWLLKDSGHPDYIIHVMSGLCYRCYADCNSCQKPIRENMIGWLTNFDILREWYIMKLEDKEFKKAFELYTNKKQINKTTGRNIPINLLKNEVGTIQCNLQINNIT